MRDVVSFRRPTIFLLLCVVVWNYTACTSSSTILGKDAARSTRGLAPILSERASASAPKLDINSASAKDLELLAGVGPVLASRILAHRERFGRFRRVEHLMMVRGMSERRFMALRDEVEAR